MTNFAYFLEKIDSMTEGAGTLLDSSLIYATSCTAWGKTARGRKLAGAPRRQGRWRSQGRFPTLPRPDKT